MSAVQNGESVDELDDVAAMGGCPQRAHAFTFIFTFTFAQSPRMSSGSISCSKPSEWRQYVAAPHLARALRLPGVLEPTLAEFAEALRFLNACACGRQGDPGAVAPASTDGMTGMAMDPAPGAEDHQGSGTLTEIDPVAGMITVDHGPIAEAGWPAMTMGFKASSAVAKDVKVGDKVAFDLTLQDSVGEITAIQKQ